MVVVVFSIAISNDSYLLIEFASRMLQIIMLLIFYLKLYKKGGYITVKLL